MDSKLRQAIEQFKESAMTIQALWDNQLDKDYPFDRSFDEVVYDIATWLEDK